jgi:hypothetical protein
METNRPCPKCKSNSNWSEYFGGFFCSVCSKTFQEPERRVHEGWPDEKIMAKSINILVERIDQILVKIDNIEKRILKLDRPPVGVKMRGNDEFKNGQ